MNTKPIIERMLEESENIWQSYLKHPFILGLSNGDLDIKKFRFYLLQDYLYLFDYAKVFAHTLTKTDNKQIMSLCSFSINNILNGEMKIHKSYMSRMGISDNEIEKVKLSLTNLSYTSYMLNVAEHGDETAGLAAILSCAISYEFIGKWIAENYPQSVNHEFYGEWVSGYSGEEYANANRKLENLMNKLCENISDEKAKKLIDIFVICSEYEYKFWDMAWNME